MKFINTLSSMLLATFLLENAYAGIDQETHVEVNIYNQTQDLSLRCYGEPIRQGDVGNMYDNMDYVNIGNNDIDRGRLIADSSPAHHYNIDAETIYADFVDYANTYNVSWAVCYVYPSVHLSCMDTNYQSVPVDITDKTSANAYAYSTGYIGGPDPWIFFAPATDYDDMPQVERYDSPIAVIEIGMTPMSDVFITPRRFITLVHLMRVSTKMAAQVITMIIWGNLTAVRPKDIKQIVPKLFLLMPVACSFRLSINQSQQAAITINFHSR